MLASLLNDQTMVAAQLLGLLRQEYTALKTRNLVNLEKLTDEKQVCMGHLQRLTECVDDHLKQRGFKINAAAMEAYIASQNSQARTGLQASWATLREVSIQAQRQNEINGAIIAAGRNSIEQALSLLRGPDSQNYVYGQGAQTSFRSNPHSLAKV